MNRSIISALLSVAMVVVMSSAAHALLAPHVYTCDNCHAMQQTPTLLGTVDACLTCHNSTGSASRMPIDPGAMANPFGTTPNAPSGSWSSHNWEAVMPFKAESMALEAISPDLQSGYNNISLKNTVSCERCHNIKQGYDGKPYDPATQKPFLRTPNTNDELCLDCHRTRNVTSQAFGSHPVGYRPYSTAYKANTSAFRRVPSSSNPANYSTKLGNYLKGGKVVCMTCHAPHYADSSSATYDNRSTAGGYNATGLANSKGMLLRTDFIGASSAAINMCSGCHKESAEINHNSSAKNQNIQCGHCHNAHVDYTGDGSAPNQFLINRFMNVSTQYGKVVNKKVVFNSATSLKFVAADGTGVCQSCHAVPPSGGKYPTDHDVTVARNTDCNGCHTHKAGWSVSPFACKTCHGQPPTQNVAGGPDGYAAAYVSSGAFKNEAQTPHGTHAGNVVYNYACKECHYDGVKAGYHKVGSFQSVFIDPTGTIGAATGFPNNTTHYNRAAGSCSNVYCHSNGKPRGGSISWKQTSISWANGKNTIVGQPQIVECNSCHDFGAINTNAHYGHVTTAGKSCNACHSSTVDANNNITISGRANHANGTKAVTFAGSGSFDTAAATCSNSCHTNGQGVAQTPAPLWTELSQNKGTDVYCGKCHAVKPATGAHFAHFTSLQGPRLTAGLSTVATIKATCNNCHVNTTVNHANGIANVVASCAPCHPGANPTWTNPASVTCKSCHVGTASVVGSYTAPLMGNFSSLGHGKWSLSSQCTSCHSATAPHIGAGPTQKRLNAATVSAVCDGCHTTAAGLGLPAARLDLKSHTGFVHYTSTASNNVAKDCTACHDTHGTTNLSQIRTVINGLTVVLNNISSGFITTTPDGNGKYHGICQVCHTRTKVYKNTQAVAGNGHDQKWCMNCHKHKQLPPDFMITFAFQGLGGCNTCHGYPPVQTTAGLGTLGNYTGARLENYSGGGGAHSVAGHIAPTASPTQQFGNCTNCHFTGSAQHNQGGTAPFKPSKVNVEVDPKYKFNASLPITYSGNQVDPPARNTTGTCSNVSCHFQASPKWSNER